MRKKLSLPVCLSIFFTLFGCQFPLTAVQTTSTPDRSELVSVEPLPNHLETVIPQPGSTYTLSEYQRLAPDAGVGADRPGVCLYIWPISDLMEPGDIFPTADSWLKRVHFSIDGRNVEQYHSLMKTNMTEKTLLDPDTGEIIWQSPPEAPYEPCYAVDLEVGRHIATVVVEKTSGTQISYTWPFTITE